MAGPIGIDEILFAHLEGEELLQSIRTDDLRGTEDRLREVLGRIPLRCRELKDDITKQNRKSWRLIYRIKVYNNLLLLALGAEGEEWNTWKDDNFMSNQATSKLSISGSIYTYLLDQIHEDEEIMFKYYRIQNRSKKTNLQEKPSLRDYAFWLVQSVKIYREHLVIPVAEALKEWEEDQKKEVCKELLDKAKAVFKAQVLSHGRSLNDRSLWNRARLYWLLALAKHAAISKGRVGNFRSFTYSGPIRSLVQEMIKEDEEMFLEISNEEDSSLIQFTKVKYDKVEKDLALGTFKICSLLDWASAVNDEDLVLCIFERKQQHMKSVECDWKGEKLWAESWANALWIAAYKGHAQIVKELLHCKFPPEFPYHELYSEHYSDKEMQPPLHVAVRRGHISVVEVFCTKSKNFSFHEKDHKLQQTPLEVATNLKDEATKKKIQSILLQRAEVKQAVDELCTQRELTVGSANAIIVGATLIAGVTYGGWLSPPLGYESYYQFAEPLPAPPSTYESYMSIQGHTTIQVFAICNSLSFFFAIAAVVAGMETTCFIEVLEETYMAKTLEKLRYKLKWTTSFFIASVICVLIAFACAGIAILPPIEQHQRRMYITIGVGGTICMVFLCRMLLFCVSKRLYMWTTSRFGRKFKRMVGKFYPSILIEVVRGHVYGGKTQFNSTRENEVTAM